MREAWAVTRGSVTSFFTDDALSHAAAIAFYTALSFAPIVLLLVTLSGYLGDGAQNRIIEFFERQMGAQASSVADDIISQSESAAESGSATWRVWLSLGMLLFTATAVFAQLQHALNNIWGVRQAAGGGVTGFLRKRAVSALVLIGLFAVLLVGIVVSSMLGAIFPDASPWTRRLSSAAVSFVVYGLGFWAIFAILPDARVRWQHAAAGAAVTGALFVVGQEALAACFNSFGGAGAHYGNAAGSVVALLVWVYYSAAILLLGAEVTQQIARVRGEPIAPAAYAVPV